MNSKTLKIDGEQIAYRTKPLSSIELQRMIKKTGRVQSNICLSHKEALTDMDSFMNTISKKLAGIIPLKGISYRPVTINPSSLELILFVSATV